MNNSMDIKRRSAEFGASEAARLYSKNPAAANIAQAPSDQLQQNSGSPAKLQAGDSLVLSHEAKAGHLVNAATRVNFENWGMSSGSQTETQSQKQVASVEKSRAAKPPESPKPVAASDLDGGMGALNGPNPGEMSISQSNEAQVVRKTDQPRKSTGFTVTPEQPVISKNG